MTTPWTDHEASSREASISLNYDYFARARTLEGAFKLPKGQYSNNVHASGFFTEGPSFFEGVHPDWFSSRDQGLYDAMLGGAFKVLRVQTGEATAEEVAQNMASGLSVGGGVRSDVYGDLGSDNAGAIRSGKSPRQLRSTVFGWAQNRALDVWRKEQRHKKEREKSHPSLIVQERQDESRGGDIPAEVVLDRTPNEVMLSLISDPSGGRAFREWVYRTIERKATEVQKIIVEASLDHLARHGEWPSANAIREKVIETKGSDISIRKINDHRKSVEDLLAREMQKNPKVLDWIDRYLDLAALGYGGGQLRLARKVADRFLRTRSASPSKTAGFDLMDRGHDLVWKLHSDYEARTEVAFDKLKGQLEKALLGIDLVMDRRTTHFERWDHHEGPRFVGVVAFVDKRDHNVRGSDQIREDLEAVGIYLPNPKQDGRGVWSVSFGG